MDNLSTYTEQFFTFNNPFFLGIILTIILISVCTFIVLKVILPLHKESVEQSQRFLWEKAELMALFSQMDPDPLIRIDNNNRIIQTNEIAKIILDRTELDGKNILDIIPGIETNEENVSSDYILHIKGKSYTLHIKSGKSFNFKNIYLHDITLLKSYEAKLLDYQDRLKILAEKKDIENDDLRQNISFELHDNICQKLIMLKYHVADLDFRTDGVQSEIEEIYQNVRGLSKELRPADLPNLGLKICIKNLIDEVSTKANINGAFQCGENLDNLSESIAKCIFSVVQVGLSNIIRHSKAKEFEIKITLNNQDLNLLISDDGVGITEDYFKTKNYKKYGVGLFNIKERVEKLRGTFKIITNNENGTALLVKIPLKVME